MVRRSTRWRTTRSQLPKQRSRSRKRNRDWIITLIVVGVIVYFGLGEPLRHLDELLVRLGFIGFR